MSLQEPASSADTPELFTGYLDFYRALVESKLRGLTDAQLDTAVLPSGWTPRGLLAHLVHMEQRWFVWGVAGQYVEHPWGDRSAAGGWQTGEGDTLDVLLERLHAGGRRTSEIVAATPLTAQCPPGPRFEGEPPTALWVCFHVLQEYARHAGHLDAVRELLDGSTGEH